jgi:hypothetical protein
MNWDEVIALRKAFESVKQRQQKNLPQHFGEMTQKLKNARGNSVGNVQKVWTASSNMQIAMFSLNAGFSVKQHY